ncbi:hypothetical protein [Macrococcoides bohemicum]|uniref:hypothetical protein n=1 Tax=Macrococcoides bohemicum TaxID=1903056 RepID=UPI00289A88F8|nr:hypothetical protein [Macrococcus bohemicus]
MMKIKIAPNDPQSMSQDGDAILRSLQNNSLPMVDLLVRESLQNSLDATKENEKVTEVDYIIKKFKTRELSSYFEKITDELNNRYKEEEYILAIKDKNTYGLTGNYLSKNAKELDASNFHKLVFGIGKNQEKEGAGGSWGLGKTSYFRMGAGLVIYYTRIQLGNNYEERLIASLIESPKKGQQLLKESDRGIAWWGNYGEDEERLLPITDVEKIEEILSTMNLKRYKDEETGTTIIIPFINNEYDRSLNFLTEIENEITLAVKRWYSPRIYNKKYVEKFNASYLSCFVNDIEVNKLGFEPVFEYIHDLYTSSLTGKSVRSEIVTEKVMFPQSPLLDKIDYIGYVSFIEVDENMLKTLPPYNMDPTLKYLNLNHINNENHNAKVMAYCRKPGMIVEYATGTDWFPAAPVQKENHMLLAFFVPNSNAVLNEKYNSMGYKDIESYLRATENADHANWTDADKVGIINRMKKNSKNIIENAFQDNDSNIERTMTSALARKFGSLLPPRNYGIKGTPPKVTPPVKVKNKNRKVDVTILDSNPISENKVEIEFDLHLKKGVKSTVFLQVLTQEQRMDSLNWIKTMGEDIRFPFNFETVEIENGFELDIDLEKHSFNINNELENDIDIKGKSIIKSVDNIYIPSIAIRNTKQSEELN